MEKNEIRKKQIVKEKIKQDKTMFITDIYSWLQSTKIYCKQSTYSHYEYTVYSKLIPEFGEYKKNQMSRDLINHFTEKLLNDGLEPKTVRDILTILNQILKYGNIQIQIIMPKIKRKKIQIYTKEDQEILEKELIKNINESNFGIYLCLYTGLRIGEICALKWENIDLNNNIIKIQKTLIRVKNDRTSKKKTKLILDDPKSVSSIRSIPIPMFIIPILKKLKKNEECFFLTGKNTFIEPRCYLNHYKKILASIREDKSNFREYNFHALRHTFATRCIENGFDPKTLSEILGHSSVKITLERYVHPSFDIKVKMMNHLKPIITNFKDIL